MRKRRRPARQAQQALQPDRLLRRQKNQTSKSWLKFLPVMSLIFFVLFAGIALWWWGSPSSWDVTQEQHIVIVPKVIDVNTNHILFIKIDIASNNISLTTIPALEEVELRGGYGRYPLKSVYPLLMLDTRDARTVRAAYSYALQTTIDQVWTSGEDQVFAAQSLAELGQHISSRKISAPLSLKDRIELSRTLRGYSEDRQEYATVQSWKSSSTTRYSADFRSCRVGVTNASSKPGQAAIFEEIVTGIGGIVVRTAAQSTQEPLSRIYVQPEQPSCRALLFHLQALMPYEVEGVEDESVFSRVRSEIELVIGDDLAEYLAP